MGSSTLKASNKEEKSPVLQDIQISETFEFHVRLFFYKNK
jgi:hypothetical protein